MAPWLRQVIELIHAGKRAEAIAQTRSLAEQGNLAARVRLAVFGSEAGLSREEIDRVVDEAHSIVPADDSTAHWVLRGAYDLRLGACKYEEKSRRVLFHLEAYARLTEDPMATLAVARSYAQGSIGIPSNKREAEQWYERAVQRGHPEAARELQRMRDA